MRGVPGVRHAPRALEVDGRLALGVVSAPGAAQALAGLAGRRGLGRRPRSPRLGGHLPRGACACRTSSDLASASVVYSSLTSIARSGRAPGFVGLLERVWRDRGLGDFWGYMLVAEGAAEAMIEAEVSRRGTWPGRAPSSGRPGRR